jgi:hypothetical protein
VGELTDRFQKLVKALISLSMYLLRVEVPLHVGLMGTEKSKEALPHSIWSVLPPRQDNFDCASTIPSGSTQCVCDPPGSEQCGDRSTPKQNSSSERHGDRECIRTKEYPAEGAPKHYEVTEDSEIRSAKDLGKWQEMNSHDHRAQVGCEI